MSLLHISGWVEVTEPHGPSGPIDPGWGGGAPVYPSHGLPGGGHIDNSLPWAPVRPGHKPPGRPVLPPSIDNGLPPTDPPHIWGGGHWEPIDPGFGKPPIFGFVPVDPGFGVGEPPVAGHPLPKPPGGQWVPTDPDYGKPVGPCGGGKPHPPIWVWIPTQPIFPDNTLPPAPAPK